MRSFIFCLVELLFCAWKNDEGDYTKNLQIVCLVIINKRSFEYFMYLDLSNTVKGGRE